MCIRDSPKAANIAAARKVIPELLSLFDDFGISATWATVGFLFAQNLSELETYKPRVRPQYSDTSLDPYREWAVSYTHLDVYKRQLGEVL